MSKLKKVNDIADKYVRLTLDAVMEPDGDKRAELLGTATAQFVRMQQYAENLEGTVLKLVTAGMDLDKAAEGALVCGAVECEECIEALKERMDAWAVAITP